ncbi:[protein-PII] uridylyltransferase [Thioflexithrix psekupsensis]|uniref:Bifunctional uridylyltransferase/uridylyl-removing enzyme n=1 Tax=Thioflexithrix psekupsensis TaxID=1570016 RepID=A0A251X9Z4_9GAMM|nr:[protein-PII] uridylyltransferase [Thioflexithrix psekupsensis]OUD15004.1 [protein-PII] uridylyltransferase [Thioflexithrix psekupsensis]
MYPIHYPYADNQLFDSEAFERALQTDETPISVFRKALQQGREIIAQRFLATYHASEAVSQQAWLVDQILQHAWQRITWPASPQIALVAVGGYGRAELHPSSDVDIMILLGAPADAEVRRCVEEFIMFLWDIRLEVGHSTRTLVDCVHESSADITVVTTLMESRLLLGPSALYQDMQACVGRSRVWPSREFFEGKLQEQQKRHQKYHDTAYNLEPNIKEGPGGLRDIQMIGWVAKRHFDANTLHDLVQHDFLTETEYQQLIRGQEFLWKVRYLLHTIAKRREDRLLFDYQRTLADRLGFYDDDTHLGVEKFMRQYYRTIKELSSLNDMLLQLFQEAILYAHLSEEVWYLNKRFRVRNHYIEVNHDKVFRNYPFALLEIFLLMQQHPEIRGVRASTIRLIRQYTYLIDEAFHRDLRARSLFYEIIRQPEGLTKALRRMNRYGILGAYIPAFGRIVGQMQYDLFHVYTVDEHSLFVVRNLRRFAMARFREEMPTCHRIMQLIPKPELLYLAGLFHDIAKGRGGDHSELGEVDALNFSQAHGLSDNDSRLVAWLVRHHLLMSTTAQRQDITDPEVIHLFAQKIQDKSHLDYLYLLTVADIRATNPKLWNSWKAKLLTDLYYQTRAALQQGLDYSGLDKQARIQEVQYAARQQLSDLSPERISDLWTDLGEDYFLYTSPYDIADETRAILHHELTVPNEPLVMERRNHRGGSQFLLIYLKDRDYLFAATTHFLEQKNLNIVDAYIVPTQREYTLGGYTVLEQDGGEINNPQRVQEIVLGLRQALSSELSQNLCPISRHVARYLKHFPVPTRITFSYDKANNHTVLEVITSDRPGVLSRIAEAFVKCNVRVKRAKIATLGARVEDIFFITDYENRALHSADHLDLLREELSDLLEVEGSHLSSTTRFSGSELVI